MPVTYTNSLRLTKPEDGDTNWGQTVNTGITDLVDTSVAGTATITMTTADYTLSNLNGVADEARAMFIVIGGTPGAARNVICPAVSKLYYVTNNTTGGFAQTFKTASGTGISVPNGKSMLLRCDGTNVVNAVTNFGSLAVNNNTLTIGGAFTTGGTFSTAGTFSVAGGNLTLTLTGATSVTLPTTGTLSTLAGTETLTNKTLSTGCTFSGNVIDVQRGGTGAATLSGILKGNGTIPFTAATAGTDYVAPGTATTFTARQTFTSSTTLSPKLFNAAEAVNVVNSVPTGTINVDVFSNSVVYYLQNSTTNWIVNIRGNGSTTLDSVMSVGEAVTVVFMATQGAIPYYITSVTVDGGASTANLNWLGGPAPTAGVANGVNVYSFTLIKARSSGTKFEILASLVDY